MKIFCSYKKILLLLFLSLIIAPNLQAQKIKWENIQIGVEVTYFHPSGDLGQYWGNSFSIGPILSYKADDNLFLEGGILGTYLKSKNETNLPNIIFLNIPAGIKYSTVIYNSLKGNFSTGLVNSTFIFEEDESFDAVNDIESEFGYFISIGIENPINELLDIEIFGMVHNIFSSPEGIVIYSAGIKVFFN